MASACEYASSRSSRAQSRTRLRIALPRSDVSQQRSISSTSSQRPALWKPSAGARGRPRERVLELVAVVEDRLGRDDLLERRLLDAAEAAQRVLDLALLLLELHLVREILEAAAAAGGIVRARRLHALRAGREKVDRQRLRVVPLHLRHACPHAVAGEAAPDEDDVAVQPRNTVAAVREGLDVELDFVVTPNGSGHGTTVALPSRGSALRARRRHTRLSSLQWLRLRSCFPQSQRRSPDGPASSSAAPPRLQLSRSCSARASRSTSGRSASTIRRPRASRRARPSSARQATTPISC